MANTLDRCLSFKSKQIFIQHLSTFFLKIKEGSQYFKRTAEVTGVSRATVRRIMQIGMHEESGERWFLQSGSNLA